MAQENQYRTAPLCWRPDGPAARWWWTRWPLKIRMKPGVTAWMLSMASTASPCWLKIFRLHMPGPLPSMKVPDQVRWMIFSAPWRKMMSCRRHCAVLSWWWMKWHVMPEHHHRAQRQQRNPKLQRHHRRTRRKPQKRMQLTAHRRQRPRRLHRQTPRQQPKNQKPARKIARQPQRPAKKTQNPARRQRKPVRRMPKTVKPTQRWAKQRRRTRRKHRQQARRQQKQVKMLPENTQTRQQSRTDMFYSRCRMCGYPLMIRWIWLRAILRVIKKWRLVIMWFRLPVINRLISVAHQRQHISTNLANWKRRKLMSRDLSVMACLLRDKERTTCSIRKVQPAGGSHQTWMCPKPGRIVLVLLMESLSATILWLGKLRLLIWHQLLQQSQLMSQAITSTWQPHAVLKQNDR